MVKSKPAVSFGIKLALALMFIPVMLFAVLVGTKTVLPVFPINFQGGLHSLYFFEWYSNTALTESIVLCLSCLVVGIFVLIREGSEKGFGVLADEFVQDLINPKRIIKRKT